MWKFLSSDWSISVSISRRSTWVAEVKFVCATLSFRVNCQDIMCKGQIYNYTVFYSLSWCMFESKTLPEVLAWMLDHRNTLTGIKHIMAGQKHTYTQGCIPQDLSRKAGLRPAPIAAGNWNFACNSLSCCLLYWLCCKTHWKTSLHQQGWAPQNLLSLAKIVFRTFYNQEGSLGSSSNNSVDKFCCTSIFVLDWIKNKTQLAFHLQEFHPMDTKVGFLPL